MQPAWMRPAYFSLATLAGLALAIAGVYGMLTGIVHLAAPDLGVGGGPDLVNPLALMFSFENGTDAQSQEVIRRFVRAAAKDDIVRGSILLFIGGVVYMFHRRELMESELPSAVAAATQPTETDATWRKPE